MHVENLILELKEAYKRENDILFHLDDLSKEHKEFQAKLYDNEKHIAQLNAEFERCLKQYLTNNH